MKKNNTFVYTLSAVYCILMIWLLFGQRISGNFPKDYISALSENINLIPFRTIIEYASTGNNTADTELLRHAFINLAGNIVMFIPLGFFLSYIWKKLRSFGRHIFYTIIIIAVIEALQLFTLLGSFDVDDLILNVIGSEIGAGIFAFINTAIINFKSNKEQ